MPGFSSELSIPYGGFALRPTDDIKNFNATSSCQNDNRGECSLITNPFHFLSLSPFISSSDNEKQSNCLEQKQQTSNDAASMIDIKLPVVTKMDSDEPVCDPELESNGKPYVYECSSGFGIEKSGVLNGIAVSMWNESAGNEPHFVMPDAKCPYPESSAYTTPSFSSQSHIPSYYSSKKDFENYLKRQQLNINLSRNSSMEAIAAKDSPQKNYPANLKVPPRVLHETRCKSIDEFTHFVKYMSPDKRLLFENKYQLSPGTLDAIPYLATTPQTLSPIQSDTSNIGEDVRSLFSSLSIATTTNSATNAPSVYEVPKINNVFGAFDRDASCSGLMENSFVDANVDALKPSEAVRKTSDLNNNLASLLYSNLPYFQAFMMLQNQQCMLNMATSVASSVGTSSNDATNVSGDLNSHDQSFMQSANNILRNMNFNYALFNELMSQQQNQPHQQQNMQGQQSAQFSAYQSQQCKDHKGHSPGLLPNLDEKNGDAFKSGQNFPQSVFGYQRETETNSKSALISPPLLNGYTQSSTDLYNTYLSMLSSVNLSSDGVKDLLTASANNKPANYNVNGLMSKSAQLNKRSQQDFTGNSLNMRGAQSKMPSGASNWLSYSQSGQSLGTKQSSTRSSNSFGVNAMNKSNSGNRYKQHGHDSMLVTSSGSLGMHGNDQPHNHNRQHGYQSSGTRNRATDMLLANVALAVEQYKSIENERKKTEVALSHLFPSHDMRSDNGRSNQTPRLPPNPTRVDRLVGEMQKEQPKVLVLISKAEDVLRPWISVGVVTRGVPLEVGITMDQWQAAIRKVQARRREDTNSQANRQRHLPVGPTPGSMMPGTSNSNMASGSNSNRGYEDKDRIALCNAVRELTEITRKARSMQWVFLQHTREAAAQIEEASHAVATEEPSMSSVNALLAEATDKRLLSDESEDSVFEAFPRQIWSTGGSPF